jgi:hypothetical protein
MDDRRQPHESTIERRHARPEARSDSESRAECHVAGARSPITGHRPFLNPHGWSPGADMLMQVHRRIDVRGHEPDGIPHPEPDVGVDLEQHMLIGETVT